MTEKPTNATESAEAGAVTPRHRCLQGISGAS